MATQYIVKHLGASAYGATLNTVYTITPLDDSPRWYEVAVSPSGEIVEMRTGSNGGQGFRINRTPKDGPTYRKVEKVLRAHLESIERETALALIGTPAAVDTVEPAPKVVASKHYETGNVETGYRIDVWSDGRVTLHSCDGRSEVTGPAAARFLAEVMAAPDWTDAPAPVPEETNSIRALGRHHGPIMILSGIDGADFEGARRSKVEQAKGTAVEPVAIEPSEEVTEERFLVKTAAGLYIRHDGAEMYLTGIRMGATQYPTRAAAEKDCETLSHNLGVTLAVEQITVPVPDAAHLDNAIKTAEDSLARGRAAMPTVWENLVSGLEG